MCKVDTSFTVKKCVHNFQLLTKFSKTSTTLNTPTYSSTRFNSPTLPVPIPKEKGFSSKNVPFSFFTVCQEIIIKRNCAWLLWSVRSLFPTSAFLLFPVSTITCEMPIRINIQTCCTTNIIPPPKKSLQSEQSSPESSLQEHTSFHCYSCDYDRNGVYLNQHMFRRLTFLDVKQEDLDKMVLLPIIHKNNTPSTSLGVQFKLDSDSSIFSWRSLI